MEIAHHCSASFLPSPGSNTHSGTPQVSPAGLQIISKVSEVCMWVDVARLIGDAVRMRKALEELGRLDGSSQELKKPKELLLDRRTSINPA